jgi:hypothetical protein
MEILNSETENKYIKILNLTATFKIMIKKMSLNFPGSYNICQVFSGSENN